MEQTTFRRTLSDVDLCSVFCSPIEFHLQDHTTSKFGEFEVWVKLDLQWRKLIEKQKDTRKIWATTRVSIDTWLLPASLILCEEIHELLWENYASFFWISGNLFGQVLKKDYLKLWETGERLLTVIWKLGSPAFLSTHLLNSAKHIYVRIIKKWARHTYKRKNIVFDKFLWLWQMVHMKSLGQFS